MVSEVFLNTRVPRYLGRHLGHDHLAFSAGRAEGWERTLWAAQVAQQAP